MEHPTDTPGAPEVTGAIDALWEGYASTSRLTGMRCTDDLLDLLNVATGRAVRAEIAHALTRLAGRRMLTVAEARAVLAGVSAAVNVDDAFGHVPFGGTVREPA
jgi:hypothetical protein